MKHSTFNFIYTEIAANHYFICLIISLVAGNARLSAMTD